MKPGIGRRLNQQSRDQRTGFRKLKEPQVREFKTRVKAGESHTAVAKDMGIKSSTGSNIATGQTWAWVIV